MTATLLLQIAAKATLVLLAGLGLTRAMGRASAASRHWVWVLTLAAALGVPAMHVAGPAWTLTVLPQDLRPSATIEPVTHTAGRVGTTSGVTDRTATELTRADSLDRARVQADDAVLDFGAADPLTAAVPEQPEAPTDWGQLLVRVWLVGVVLMLLRLALGVVWATVTVRRAHDLPHTGWLDSLDEAAAQLGLARSVGLKVSSRAAVPMATGLWRAVVLLPLSAIDWPEERRRVVLQHELAHVKRRDCLLQALAQCVSAVHWFNPAVHMAVSRLRAEQERACDDLVIQVGTDARSYADHLFEIARSFRAASFPTWVAMSMARPSQLEGRMLAILDSARVRCAPSLSMRAALLCATVMAVVPFGALRLGAQTAEDTLATLPQVGSQSSPIADAVEDLAARADVTPRQDHVEIVHGDLVDVDLIVPGPSFSFADVMHLGGRVDDDRAARLSEQVVKDVTTSARWLLAQAPAAGQTPAVSDETRRRVADALITALNDDNSEVRQEALSALASMRDERAVPGLVRALGDPVADVRMRALGALVQFNTAAAADGVVTALKDRDANVREQAARHLASMVSRGQLRDAKYVDAFSGLLRDDNADVRQQAALALGNLADPRAIDALTAALKDAEPSVREQAARALGQIARGQRRGVRPTPGVPVPPPVVAFPPRALAIDEDRLRELTERAQEQAERAQRDLERQFRDFDLRFDRFRVPAPPAPEPAPVPAPAPPR